TTAPDLGDLYRHEAARLWRAVFAYAQGRAITDDAVAEAFAQCLRRGSEVRDPRAWIWRASFRMAAGELKARRGISPQGGTLAPACSLSPSTCWMVPSRSSEPMYPPSVRGRLRTVGSVS